MLEIDCLLGSRSAIASARGMNMDEDSTLIGLPAERELIKDANGRVVAEILLDDGMYTVVRREKPTFPPTSRNTLVGSFDSIQAARQAADLPE